jgi:hypothetical protein
LDSVEPTDAAATAEGEGGFGESEEMAAKRKLLEEYYMDRIATLTKSLQHATGRATYYKQEVDSLLYSVKLKYCRMKTMLIQMVLIIFSAKS